MGFHPHSDHPGPSVSTAVAGLERSPLRRVGRFLLVLGLGLTFTLGSLSIEPSWAKGDQTVKLERRLGSSPDFRVRMQAALELGKLKSRSSRGILENALRDESAAVRAAAAAALESLGEKRALPALRKAQDDDSQAVRNQVAAAIRALDTAVGVSYIVGLGEVESDASVPQKSGKYLKRIARRRLSRLPGVQLKASSQVPPSDAPEVLLDARISRLREHNSGPTLQVSAKVDFVLSRMPGREIKGRLTGAATVHGDARAQNKVRELDKLRMEAVEAATDSALENVERALRAAVE